MDCAAVYLPCCVGMCCRENSWLGVRRTVRYEGLVMGCVGGYLLYSQVRRGGWCRRFVVLWSVFCVGGIFPCIGSLSSSYAYSYDMSLIVAACLLLSRIRVYFVRCTNSCFIISLLYTSTCFEHYVLIIRRSELYYTASGIITLCRWPSRAQIERGPPDDDHIVLETCRDI